MKLLKIDIKGYKNLSNISINSSNSTNYIAFIGLNGSGKSNLLEAISKIFSKLYKSNLNPSLNFQYTIRYLIKNFEIEVIDGKMTLIKENGFEVNRRVLAADRGNYLPSEIITCYSGDEHRLWEETYFKFYRSYIQEILKGSIGERHRLIYINKYAWEIALVSLLCHENSGEYIKNLLNIRDLSDIKIQFVFPNNYDKLKQSYIKIQETGVPAKNEALDLLQIIKDTQNSSRTKSLTYNDIKDILIIANIDNTKKCRKLFHLLYSVGSDKKKKLFTRIQIKLNGFTSKQLSEGEKKIILTKCIADILANENSLMLFDEPDSHIHVARKKEIISIIDKPNYFTIFTTHSPTILGNAQFENIRFINKGKVYDFNKVKHLPHLTNGEFNYFEGAFILSSKHTIVVEGTDDIKYIKKAIEIFAKSDPKYKPLKKIAFIPQGSADHTESFFYDIIIQLIPRCDKILYLFDYDNAGITAWNKIEDYKRTHSKIENAFYQEDYTNTYDSTIKNPTNPFFIEDFFDENSYGSIIGTLPSNMNRYKEFKSRSSLHKAIKGHIEKKYLSFNDSYYNGFKPLLDKVIDAFSF